MIYNADGGLVNGALDLLHKAFSPATYPCRLCDVTYGPLGMKKAWRTTLDTLPHPVTFLHRDEWQAQAPGNPTPLPAILLETGPHLEALVSAADFATITSLEGLQALLKQRLQGIST
jgi:hypothetical protein